MKTSEFGTGLCYNLGLFLAHGEPRTERLEHDETASWFNAASDHLYDLRIKDAPKRLQTRLENLRDKCLEWGHGFPRIDSTKQDVAWAIQEAKALLLLIDKAHKVKVIKGEWE